MNRTLKSRLLLLAPTVVIAAFVISVFAMRNQQASYAPVGPFVGCYSAKSDRLLLRPDGGVEVNGVAVGSYRIVKPVGGKHGFLVEANGLTLAGGNRVSMQARGGTGGFLWPINDKALEVTFAPAAAMTLRKMPLSSC